MKPHFSPFTEAGGFVFVSGQLGFDAQGELTGDAAAQTRQAIDNLKAVLARSGLDLTDVVKTTVWVVRREDFAAYNAAYAEAFGEHKPARSTVISGLALPDALVEIEAVALKRS